MKAKYAVMTEKQAERQAAKELGIQVVTRANKGKLARRAKEILEATR